MLIMSPHFFVTVIGLIFLMLCVNYTITGMMLPGPDGQPGRSGLQQAPAYG
jgi:hypothetical protein